LRILIPDTLKVIIQPRIKKLLIKRFDVWL